MLMLIQPSSKNIFLSFKIVKQRANASIVDYDSKVNVNDEVVLASKLPVIIIDNYAIVLEIFLLFSLHQIMVQLTGADTRLT